MRAVIQRVLKASVDINDEIVADIESGILSLVGFRHDDDYDEMDYVINKILGLRIFDDEKGVMNLSVVDVENHVLLVPQFTLYGDVRKGKRPSYSSAMSPNKADAFFMEFIKRSKLKYNKIKSGIFGANMKVSLVNTGPVTILIDSDKKF
ncbi:D-aminoacyl-tRNA deacylase [Spirochaetota bacterium]